MLFIKKMSSFKEYLSIFLISCGSCFIGHQISYNLTKPPLISVILPTYNRAHWLPEAVDSILAQTFTDFELIIINDGSTDETAEVIREYQNKDKRIKVITHDYNRGIVAGLNDGLKIARGKYIARMDDDDVSVPRRFELQKSFLEEHQDITVVGSTRYIQAHYETNVQSIYVNRSDDFCALMSYYEVPIFHPSAMIRFDFLKEHNITYNHQYPSAEDTAFWHEIVKKGGKIVQIAPPLVQRRTDAPQKEGYNKQQFYSFVRFMNDSLKSIRGDFQFTSWPSTNELCFILQNIHKDSLYNKAFNDKSIQHLKKMYGCHENSLYHPDTARTKIIETPL